MLIIDFGLLYVENLRTYIHQILIINVDVLNELTDIITRNNNILTIKI